MNNGIGETITNARDLIDRYYGRLGIEAPTKYLKSETDYAESLLRRYQAGPDFISHVIDSVVERKGLSGTHPRFTDIKRDVQLLAPGMEREWIERKRFEQGAARLITDKAPAEYTKEINIFAQKAIDDGAISKDQLAVFKQMSEDEVTSETKQADAAEGNRSSEKNDLMDALARMMSNARETMIQDRLLLKVGLYCGFETQESFVQRKLDEANLTLEHAKEEPKKRQPINTHSSNASALSEDSKVSSPTKKPNSKLPHQVATEVVIDGYSYSPSSKKNFVSIRTQGFSVKHQPFKLFLTDRHTKYDASKNWQGNLLDRRFIEANPIGTKLVAHLKHLGGNTFSTSFMRVPISDTATGNFTLMQVDQPVRVHHSHHSRVVAMRWFDKAVDAKHIYTLESKFRRSQSDILRTQNPWVGYQVREVFKGTVVGLSPVVAWNTTENRSPNMRDLEQTVFRYQAQHQNNPDVKIEIALFEAIKVMPGLRPRPEVEKQMLDCPTLLRPNNYQQTQLGGQVVSRGLIEYRRDPEWGMTVVSGSKYLEFPAPNPEQSDNHIHLHVKGSDGKKLQLNRDIALSASGKTKESMVVGEIHARPEPVVQRNLNLNPGSGQ